MWENEWGKSITSSSYAPIYKDDVHTKLIIEVSTV